jgi:non-ribosomal peptide synthetase component F
MRRSAFSHQESRSSGSSRSCSRRAISARILSSRCSSSCSNAPSDRFETGRLSIEECRPPRDAARFDLELQLWETATARSTDSSAYNADLFEPATVRALAERFRVIVTAVARSRSTRLSALYGLTGEERERVIGLWSGMRRERPLESTLLGAFDRVVRRGPRRRARSRGRRSGPTRSCAPGRSPPHGSSLAKGIGPESRVGLAMDRSPDLVVAMLGILGAGAAYVPIDPPRLRSERLACSPTRA